MNKTIVSALVLGMVLASCSKTDERVTDQVRVLSYAMCENGSMYTKGVATDDVTSAIQNALPDKVSFTATSFATSKAYKGKTGEPIVLPSDLYHVIGSSSGNALSSCLQGSSGYVTDAPKIDINCDLNVTDNETAYTLQATYKSFAIVVDAEETAKVFIKGKGEEEEITPVTSGAIKIAFVQGDYSSTYLTLRIVPTDKERYDDATYTLASQSGSNLVHVEAGKFYVFHPKVNGQEPKVIGLSLPNFERVDVSFN